MMTRAENAGRNMATSIIEMAHLMYQNNTAEHFYRGLLKELNCEITLREISKKKEEN